MGVVDGISVERAAHVATVWLDRPDRGNGFVSAMQVELHRRLAELDDDEDVRAIVVTGRGRFFSTGADMEPGGSNFAFDEEQTRAARAMMAARTRPWELRTPIIGALNGPAVGLGLTFALQWDIRVVNESAKYGFVFTRRGLIPEQNSLWLLPRLVGAAKATELLLTGRLFRGDEAQRMGLATQALPGEQVLPAALGIATEIATECSPAAVGLTKRLIYQMLAETDREAAFRREWEIFRWTGRQPDSAEGVAAFLEKRKPEFPSGKDVSAPLADVVNDRAAWMGER
ncbi:enoyl-CoA hydratase-related protein [Nocardia sp. alder85J]|uniref:enoyl-CoA hydratase-related protein n=1 Tax=Nocardia sp. alder85J TaxID=2862949 RepID=UPI001CD7A1CE|nr:enoyl-CoA hydratase-related protein [Nocardia sp. alder85J]MCX4095742.1 enoyl-CoA hydratase-related protein [Nocardia sp. alder85J]